MGYRKLPFGYRMTCGVVEIHPEESDLVQKIFTAYSMGMSLKGIADELRDQGVPYDLGRIWNKNMVSRILEDERYLGRMGYTQLIEEQLYLRVSEVRGQKEKLPEPDELQKTLRELHGKRVPQEAVDTILILLNNAIERPKSICQYERRRPLREIRIVQNIELDKALNADVIDEVQIENIIKEIARGKYDRITCQSYETARMENILSNKQKMDWLDSELLRRIVKRISIENGLVTIEFKNQRTLEGMCAGCKKKQLV